MSVEGFVVILTTASNKDEGLRIARHVVKNRLAACATVVESTVSTYWWKGKVEESSEVLVIVKTRIDLVNKAIEEIKKVHTYEVPEIIVLPIIAGYVKYLEWIKDETTLGS